MGVRVGVAPRWNNLALRKKLKNLHAKSQLAYVHTDGQTNGYGYIDSAGDPDQEYIHTL